MFYKQSIWSLTTRSLDICPHIFHAILVTNTFRSPSQAGKKLQQLFVYKKVVSELF